MRFNSSNRTPPSSLTAGGDGLSRRRLLLAAGAGVGGLAVVSMTGCSSGSGGPIAGAKGKEAPLLQARIKKGELPPLKERLPKNPLVVKPTKQMGVYGGVWRNVIERADAGYLYALAGQENLVSWTPKWTGAVGLNEIVPNIAESFKMSDDATEFTFKLREGMKWSDGKPFTARDVEFAVKDVLFNKELFPSPPKHALSRNKPIKFEMIDDFNFKITTPRSDGLFLHQLAHPLGHVYTKFPRHYLEQFHPEYNSDVDKVAKEEGFKSWTDLFEKRSGELWFHGENADLPQLWPWHVVTTLDSRQVKLERNPYYWKVDPEGSQLPYIDEVTFDVLDDEEAMLAKALNGEIGLEAGPNTRFTSPKNKPLLAKERDRHGFRFLDVVETRMNIMCISFNLTHKDKVKREIFNNKDFRIGLSHAINRKDIITATMQRQGEPYQAAPLPESAFYDEAFATQYLAYDVNLANQHLDKAFPDKNAEGIRLGPDKKPISFVLEFVPELRPEWAEQLEMIRRYWKEVGVKATVRDMDKLLFSERGENSEHDVQVWHGDGGLDVLQQPKYYVAQDESSVHGVEWGKWAYSGGKLGEEPPEDVKRQLELLEEVSASSDAKEQARLTMEMLAISKEQFHVIGIARETTKYFIVKNNFHNVPNRMIQGWTYPTPGPTRPEQYYISG